MASNILVSFWYHFRISLVRFKKSRGGRKLAEKEEVARSIRLPHKVWLALDDDARRCKRSSVKHLEALLTQWYGIEDIQIYFNPEERIAAQARERDAATGHRAGGKTAARKRA